jgi:hypothetical protein
LRKQLGVIMREVSSSEISEVSGGGIIAYRRLGTGKFNVPDFRATDGQSFMPSHSDSFGNIGTGTMDGWMLYLPTNGKWEIKDNKGRVTQSWRDAVLPLDPIVRTGGGIGDLYGVGGGYDTAGDPSDADQEVQTA